MQIPGFLQWQFIASHPFDNVQREPQKLIKLFYIRLMVCQLLNRHLIDLNHLHADYVCYQRTDN